MSKTICVIAAHPDDEVLGCGGTMAKHAANGDNVHIMIMAEGATSRDLERNREKRQVELTQLSQAAQKAANVLGAASTRVLDFPDNRMDSVSQLDVVKAVETFVNEFQPSIVYTHHVSDVNKDHQVIHDAVITACRSQPGHSVETILNFEVLSSTEWQTPDSRSCFVPNWFEDIGPYIETKIEALKAYEQEMRGWPHPRSYKATQTLANWRGCIAGVDVAEAFVLSRKVNRINESTF